MNCKTATRSYEAWLAKRTTMREADLDLKHQQMSAEVFSFMRATFYRWIELWSVHCAELAGGPVVLAVGDLHVENFGTWRDREGRLVWGISDFDEAFSLSYANDLVRLAVSAHLAIAAHGLATASAEACDAIVKGYLKGLNDGGRPFVLAERNEGLRDLVIGDFRDPDKFWDKLNALASIETEIPALARAALEAALPEERLDYRVVQRSAGMGSLGRPRFTALAEWKGGLMAREAKPLLPSACVWATGQASDRTHYDEIVTQAIRCPDPCLELRNGWVVRRLAPDCSRTEMKMLTQGRDVLKLLEAMGRETANVHLGSSSAVAKVTRDLDKRPAGWLHDAAETMVLATENDWREWQS